MDKSMFVKIIVTSKYINHIFYIISVDNSNASNKYEVSPQYLYKKVLYS